VQKSGKPKSFIEILDDNIQKTLKAIEKENEEELDEMDQEDIVKFVKKHGLVKPDKIEMFKGIHCKRSLYLFGKNSWVRIGCYKLVQHRFFENTILILIVLSSLKLALDTYISGLDTRREWVNNFSEYFDIIVSFSFALESLVKSIAWGFVMDKNSYLRETWNVLDFFIVLSSMIDFAMASIDVPVIKVLRLLRTLRPLRFISHNTAMKTVTIALLESVGHIVNVVIVVIIVWLMFAILGVSLFGGKFFYCSRDRYELRT